MGDVVRRAFALTSVGIALGTGVAWVLTHALAGLFVGVSPHDPGIFVGAAAVFAVVALAAAAVPAFRTARVNPVVALTST
jgi:ABC-type antimicrobial peptide transport system permease subunit